MGWLLPGTLNWVWDILIRAKISEMNWNFAWVKTARLREILLWADGREKGGGGVKKGNGTGVPAFKCRCSPELLSSLDIGGNVRLDHILYKCVGMALPSPGMCQVFLNT